MKKIIIALVLILSTIALNAQSDRKINRLAQEAGKYVRITTIDDMFEDEEYEIEPIYCGEELVTYFINKRHFIVHSAKFQLDLDVKKRNFDGYHSLLTTERDDSNSYYVVTPFGYGDGGYGVIIMPVTKSLNPRFDAPVITIANVNICR